MSHRIYVLENTPKNPPLPPPSLHAVLRNLVSPLLQGGGGMTTGELRSQAAMSQISTQQHQQAGGAAGGSSSSSGAAALPTLPHGVVVKLVDALWEHMYKVGRMCVTRGVVWV